MPGIQVGPIQDGKQAITIGNFWAGRSQTVVSTPEKVDEFVRTHDDISKKGAKKGFIAWGATSVLGAVGGLIAKAAGLKGATALKGGFLGLLGGCIFMYASLFKAANAQNKLSEQFIAENK